MTLLDSQLTCLQPPSQFPSPLLPAWSSRACPASDSPGVGEGLVYVTLPGPWGIQTFSQNSIAIYTCVYAIYVYICIYMYIHIYCVYIYIVFNFPHGSDGKESASNAGDLGSIPGLGRSLAEENGYPFQYSCLEDSMDRGAWWAIVQRV